MGFLRPGWIRAYAAAGAAAVGLFAASEMFGWASAPDARETIAPNLRQSPGGWRSWSFWHSGLHGGK